MAISVPPCLRGFIKTFRAPNVAFCTVAFSFLLLSFTYLAETSGWFTTGTQLQYSYFDKDGNFIAYADVRITNTFTRHDTLFSESAVTWSSDTGTNLVGKGNFLFQKDSVSFLCAAGNLVPPKIRYDGSTECIIYGPPLRYPLKPARNTLLPSMMATMKFTRENGENIMRYEITDRIVENADTITTKAGTFPCWLITSTERIREHSSKPHPKGKERKVKEWYSPEYGIVKTEYRKDGVLELVRELTKVQ